MTHETFARCSSYTDLSMLMAVRRRELFGNILIVVSVTQCLAEGRKLETGRTEKKALWINKEDNTSNNMNKKPEDIIARVQINLMCSFGCYFFV